MQDKERLKLHVPEPAARPGQAPNFDAIEISAAGKVARPAPLEREDVLRHLPYALIRVLDDDHSAKGEWNPKLDADVLLGGLRHMLLTRSYDERLMMLQRQGKISFYMKSTGEEAVSIAQAYALRQDDMLFPSYRQQGLFIARGVPLLELMCQILSNAGDPLKGRQMPVMYSARSANLFSISGNLGTQYPQAVGWAMASAIKGDSKIAAAWVGDGTTAESDFHHALTFATVYKAPVILNIVNNQWAISSFQGIAGGEQATFAARALGYGLPGLRVDGNDFLAVFAATQWAAERARHNGGATLIELVTYRVAPHSTSDDPTAYRPRDEATCWPLGDPIERLKKHLIAIGKWSDAQHEALVTELDQLVRSELKKAEKFGPLGAGSHGAGSMFEDVFKEMPPHLVQQRKEMESY